VVALHHPSTVVATFDRDFRDIAGVSVAPE